MSNQKDTASSLREAFVLRELTKAQRSLSGGVAGLVVRAALVTVFMYLVFLGYKLMGIYGAAFVSVLFIVSAFLPALSKVVMAHLAKRGQEKGAAVDASVRDEA